MTGEKPDFGILDTFPKLLAENARVRGDKPASREKDYGIWLSWTWAEVAEELENPAPTREYAGERGEPGDCQDVRRCQ